MAKPKNIKEELRGAKPLNENDDDAAEGNAASIAMKPTNRLETISAAVNLMGIMPNDMLINCFDQMVQQMQYNGENVPDNWPGKNAGDIQMKPSFATGSVQESVRASLAEIFGNDQTLSEEFKAKAGTLFEAAIGARLVLEREAIKAQLDEENEEYLAEAVDNLIENLDQYITYVAEEWIKENQVAIEPTLRTEITESFIQGMKELFEIHHVDVPEDKVDIVDQLATQLEEVNTKLNRIMQENLELWETNKELYKKEIVNDMSEDLVLTQREKLRKLVEDFDVDDKLVDKIKIIKEKHFGVKTHSASNLLEESVDLPPTSQSSVDPKIRAYVNFASKLSRR